MTPDNKSSEREGGFTLVELLIAIALSGMLIVAITTVFVATLRGTATAHDRLVASNGSHTLSTYFTADVESANPDLATVDPAATIGCASEPPASTNVLRVQWSERTTSTELRAFSVSYRILASDTDSTPGSDKWQLVRYSCSASQDPFTTTMANVLSLGALTDHVVVAELHEPVAPNRTEACIGTTCTPAQPSQVVSLKAFAALVKGESAPYSYTFSATMRTPEPAPRVVSITRNGPAATNAATVAWTVKFSEPVTGVDAADFAFTYTGNATGASVASVAGSGTTYTVTANTGSGQGTLALTVDDNDTILSTIDNDPLGGSGTDNGNYTGGGYTVDRLAPAVVVTQSTGQADPASALPILFTATFNESVTDFDDAADVTNTGTAPGAVFSITGSGKDYVISVTTLTGSGTVVPSVIAAAAKDSAGNGNTVSSNGTDNQVTYNAGAPTVNITNVELRNSGGGGSNVGQLERDDQVVITFSDSMDVDTFCSTWTGTTPSITANGVVRVTVTNGGAGNDVLMVTTTSGCTFNLGSVNLGSAGWVTGTTNFEGNGGSASEIAYNDATRQLTITLGGGTSGPSGVPASTPIYSADTTNIRGSNGGAIVNSPKAATGPSRF